MFPTIYVLTKPVLEQISDGAPKLNSQIVDELANKFNLSPQERNQFLPSGGETLFRNRVRWAIFHLDKAGLISYDKRILTITPEGKNVLNQNPDQINPKFLLTLPKYVEYLQKITDRKKESSQESEELEPASDQSPDDLIEDGISQINNILKQDLLEKVKSVSNQGFEMLVLDLCKKMKYGESVQHTGKSGDQGIDGIIIEDRLGLDKIYLQAKRWEGTVTPKEIKQFAGSLQPKQTKKGIFITTSDFTPAGREYVNTLTDTTIILINGKELVKLMVEYDVGVSQVNNIRIKKIDQDYFERYL